MSRWDDAEYVDARRRFLWGKWTIGTSGEKLGLHRGRPDHYRGTYVQRSHVSSRASVRGAPPGSLMAETFNYFDQKGRHMSFTCRTADGRERPSRWHMKDSAI